MKVLICVVVGYGRRLSLFSDLFVKKRYSHPSFVIYTRKDVVMQIHQQYPLSFPSKGSTGGDIILPKSTIQVPIYSYIRFMSDCILHYLLTILSTTYPGNGYLIKIWYFCILSWSDVKFNRKNPIFTISFWDPRKIFIFISSNYVKIAHKSYVIWSNLVYLLKNLSAQLVTQISQYQKIFISLKLVNKNIIYLMQKQSRICRF